jgi:hypothetical protein
MVRTGGMAIERRRLERYRFCRWPVASRCFMLMSVGRWTKQRSIATTTLELRA